MNLLRHVVLVSIVYLSCGFIPLASANEWTGVLDARERESLKSSVHASVECVDCHSGDPMADPGDSHPAKIPVVDCSACHSDVAEITAQSVHGHARERGNLFTAQCADCHGSHDIRPKTDPRSPVYPLNLPRTCGKCHGPNNAHLQSGAKEIVTRYLDSIHGRALTRSGLLVAAHCSTCHGTHDILPKSDPASKVHRRRVPETCGTCHAGILTQFVESVHGMKLAEGDTRMPACHTCHSAHEIIEGGRSAFQLGVINQCGTCHDARLRTYRDNFHGKVTELGFAFTAKCADCHTAHAILPSGDPRSSAHADNLVETCGKCHAGANANFVRFNPHVDYKDRDNNPGLYWSYAFMTALLTGTFAFFGIHTLLWFVRESIERRKERQSHD